MSILEARDVTHRYARSDKPAVDDVSLRMEAGQVVALVGPNGSGKSTLLTTLLDRPGDGGITWFGRDLAAWPRRELARRVTYLPQRATWLPGQRVADVVASGRAPHWGAFGVESPADREATAAVMAALDLIDWADRPVESLSGGQRGRVLLGRCLAQVQGQASAAVLLDEADAALDLARSAELGKLVRNLADAGRLVVLASHDLNLAARWCDQVALMSAGRLTALGPPAEVLSEANVAATYGVAVRRVEVEGRPIIVQA
jgi:iron complex transport system ATP-binding protein